MKKINFIIYLIGLISLSCSTGTENASSSEAPYIIKGTVQETADNQQIILSTFNPITQERVALDTALLKEDKTYQLSFDFKEPDLFQVNFFGKQKVVLVIDERQNNIELNVEGKNKGAVEIKGSEDAQKLQGYEIFRQESYNRVVKPTYDAMRAASKEEDQAKEVEAVEAYAQASEDSRKELIDYTIDNIGTSIALYGTVLRWTGDDEVAKLDKLVSDFKAKRPNLKMTKVMEEKVNRFKKVAIGAPAPAFSLADTSGQTQQLADLKGTYTLLDFWASWCSPCLLQVPDLKQAYEDYHDKGFEIIGISVDTKEKRWKSAIQKYEMNWPHVSDLKGWGAEVANNYNVTFIPFNMLIDSEGNIVAKNLHSKALQGKLAELFDSK